MENLRYAHPLRILLMLNDLSLKGKWNVLREGLFHLNKILTRHYISSYWKFVFQIISKRIPDVIGTIPQFIDCLHALNIQNKNEAVYSIVYILLANNQFKFGTDLLQMYYLTANYNKEKEISILITSLNTNLDYIKWKKARARNKAEISIQDEYAKQLAEKVCFQNLNLIDSLDASDFQIKQLSDIYIYYDKITELEDILVKYTKSNPNYLNAHKYLFEFEITYKRNLSLPIFQEITRLCPSDSFVLKYCKYFQDPVISIDSVFDLLDYYQWKYDVECWNLFYKLLVKSDKLDAIKDCIRDNWELRKSYWEIYHFKDTHAIYKQIDSYRLSVAIVLFGPRYKLVKNLLKKFNLNIQTDFRQELERRQWLDL